MLTNFHISVSMGDDGDDTACDQWKAEIGKQKNRNKNQLANYLITKECEIKIQTKEGVWKENQWLQKHGNKFSNHNWLFNQIVLLSF